MTSNDALVLLLEHIALSADGPRSLAVLELRLRSGEATPLHAHDTPELVRVLDGRLLVSSGAETFVLEPGWTFSAPAGIPHALTAVDGDATYVVASFTAHVDGYARFQQACSVRDERLDGDDASLLRGLASAAGITVELPGSRA